MDGHWIQLVIMLVLVSKYRFLPSITIMYQDALQKLFGPNNPGYRKRYIDGPSFGTQSSPGQNNDFDF